MLQAFRNWDGGYSLVAVGFAFLALAALFPPLTTILVVAAGLSLAGAAIRRVLHQRRERHEDVGKLVDAELQFRRQRGDVNGDDEIDPGSPSPGAAPH